MSSDPNGVDNEAYLQACLKWNIGDFGLGPLVDFFQVEKKALREITELAASGASTPSSQEEERKTTTTTTKKTKKRTKKK
jgi:hypothetical protein